jgi:ribosomal protein S18 acetylase RimI-like enzyme
VHQHDGYPQNWPRDPVRWLAGRHTIAAWVSEQEAEIVGHLALTEPDVGRAWPQWQAALDLPAERLAAISRFFVAPTSRSQGVGASLMSAAEREAATRGRHLVLDVADHNQAAISFYAARGWREVGQAMLPAGDEGQALSVRLFVARA